MKPTEGIIKACADIFIEQMNRKSELERDLRIVDVNIDRQAGKFSDMVKQRVFNLFFAKWPLNRKKYWSVAFIDKIIPTSTDNPKRINVQVQYFENNVGPGSLGMKIRYRHLTMPDGDWEALIKRYEERCVDWAIARREEAKKKAG